MYPEFVPIYIGIVIIIVLLVIIMILLIKRTSNKSSAQKAFISGNYAQDSAGVVVFCKNCATQFDSSQRCCPKCGTPR